MSEPFDIVFGADATGIQRGSIQAAEALIGVQHSAEALSAAYEEEAIAAAKAVQSNAALSTELEAGMAILAQATASNDEYTQAVVSGALRQAQASTESSSLIVAAALRNEAAFQHEAEVAAAAAERMEAQTAGAAGIFGKLQGLFLGAFAAKEIADLTDNYTRFTNQIRVTGAEGAQLASVQEKLYEIAQRYGAPLEGLAKLYSRITIAGKELNLTQTDIMKFNEGVAAAFKISGTGAQQQRAALLELSEALSEPIVRARQLNALVAEAPTIIQAAARGAGKSVAEFQHMVKTGQVTNKEFFDDFNAGSVKLVKDASNITLTIGASFQVLSNGISKYLGESNDSLGATQLFAAAMKGLANNLDIVVPALEVIGVAYAANMLRGSAATQAARAETFNYVKAVLTGTDANAMFAKGSAQAAGIIAQAAETEVAGQEAVIALIKAEILERENDIVAMNEQIAVNAKLVLLAEQAAATRTVGGQFQRPLPQAVAFIEQNNVALARQAALKQSLDILDGELSAAEATLATAEAVATEAAAAESVAIAELSTVKRLAAGASELLGGAVSAVSAALGGPVIIAIGLAVAAYMVFEHQSEKTAQAVKDFEDHQASLNKTLDEAARYAVPAGTAIQTVGTESGTATQPVLNFAGAVGHAADQLHRLALEKKNNILQDLQKARVQAVNDKQGADDRLADQPGGANNSISTAASLRTGLSNQAFAKAFRDPAEYKVAVSQAQKAADDLKRIDAEIKATTEKPLEAYAPQEGGVKNNLLDIQAATNSLRLARAQGNKEAVIHYTTEINRLKEINKLVKLNGGDLAEATREANAHAAAIEAAATNTLHGKEDAKDAKDAARERAKAFRQETADRLAEFDKQYEGAKGNFTAQMKIEDDRVAYLKTRGKEYVDDASRARAKQLQEIYDHDQRELASRIKTIDAIETATTRGIEETNVIRKGQLEVDKSLDARDVALGIIKNKDAVAAAASRAAQEFQLELQLENSIYDLKINSIKEELALGNLTETARDELNRRLLAAQAIHETRMVDLATKGAIQAAQAQAKAAEITEAKWKSITGPVGSGLDGLFDGLYNRTTTLKQGLLNLADSLVSSLAHAGIKALSDYAAHELAKNAIARAGSLTRKGTEVAEAVASKGIKVGEVAATGAAEASKTAITGTGTGVRLGIETGAAVTKVGLATLPVVAHVAGEAVKTGATVTGTAIRTAADATGAAAAVSFSLGATIVQVGHSAVLAAARAYAAISAIPVVGPFLAPAAAVAALAAVFAIGKAVFSAEGGMERVPYDGAMIEAHKDEMVLPAHIANPLRASIANAGPSQTNTLGNAASTVGSAARQETNNNSSASFHYSPNHNYTDMSMERMLARDGVSFKRWFKNQVRNGNLSMESK